MSRETQNILVLLIGLSTGLIAVKGTYLNFVKPALFPWLLVAAVLLVALALVCLVRDLRHGPPGGHHHRGLLAWLLLVPVALTAFVAASLTMVPLVPRLVFLVVGPAVDVKLFAMQAGVFGRPFAVRFAPVTLVVAAACATAVGLLVLGDVR